MNFDESNTLPEVTALLELQFSSISPTTVFNEIDMRGAEIWRAGDAIGASELRQRQDGWSLRSRRQRMTQPELAMSDLLQALRPENPSFRELSKGMVWTHVSP